MSTPWLTGAVLLASLLGLLWAEVRGNRAAQWLFKPLASTAFVVLALQSGATGSTYGTWVLAALVLSWLGDVLLIPQQRAAFAAGLAAFLAGHLAYAGAFLELGTAVTPSVAGGAVMAVVMLIVLRWLWKHVPAVLKGPFVLYLLAISIMVALAVGTGHIALAGAAALFAVSDLFVARQRFIERASMNRLLGLPLYYAAQAIFAVSCSHLG